MSVVAEPGFMPSAVPCLQREEEFTELLELYRERKPMRVLEIGTYYGGTLYHWLQNAQPGALVVSVDSYVTGIDNRHLYGEWITRPDVTCMPVIADSRNKVTLDRVKSRSEWYDWVFIDAGHRYEEVRSDWEMYGPLCTPGGVVAFHDILYRRGPVWMDVAGLWGEITLAHETREIISDPTTEWHGIGVVFL